MDIIRFSYNWNNKLSGKYFTTIRLKDVRRFRHGETYEIHLRKGKESQFLSVASIVGIRHIKITEINEFIAGLDTGYSAEECKEIIKRMYQVKNIDWNTQLLSFILLRKEEKIQIKSLIEQEELQPEMA